MSERHIRVDYKDEAEEKLKVRHVAAGAAVGVLALGTGVIIAANLNKGEERYRQDEITKVTEADSSFLVLHEGVKARSTPDRIEDDASGESNLKFTVPSGKEVLVKFPVVAADKEGWVGFHNPKVKGSDAENLVWINVSTLEAQHEVDVVPVGKGDRYDVSLQHGEFVAGGIKELPIAAAELGSEGQFDAQIRAGGQ